MTARLGLDLGLRELRILEADGRRLLQHAEVMLPDGALLDGVPTPLATAAIRGALETASFRSTLTRVAIVETGTAVRDFKLPGLPAADLPGAVMFEGRRLVPMEPDDIYFAWDASKDGAGYAVYLAAARRDLIDGVLTAVTAAGLQVERVDLKPLALARGMRVSDGLLLDWGALEATLVLMVAARPRFFRTFALDAALDDVDGQLDELALSVNALVKFMRSSEANVSIGPATPLTVAGRFAFIEDGLQRAQQRFNFALTIATPRLMAPSGFPWQAHLAGLGLIQQRHWRSRLTPSLGGDSRVAA